MLPVLHVALSPAARTRARLFAKSDEPQAETAAETIYSSVPYGEI